MQPVPDVTAEDIDRLVAREFPASIEDVADRLSDFDLRVQAAVLKLSEGDLERLSHFAEQATLDDRDVLAWAEYPEYVEQVTTDTAEVDRQEIIERDWGQYREWFTR